MYWVAVVLLVLGFVLLGFANPWMFLEAADRGFLDWTEAFWYLQWGGFWLVTGSLLVFGTMAWMAPATFVARWRLVPVGVAVLLFVLFFICSMPEKSNERDWKQGWLGARVYVRTKFWLRGDDAGENAVPERLAGDWKAPSGFAFTLSSDAVTVKSPAGEAVWSASSCGRGFQMHYDFTYRPALDPPLPDGLGFVAFGQPVPAPLVPLPTRRFPRLYCSCDSKEAKFVLVDIDLLMVFLGSDQPLLARR